MGYFDGLIANLYREEDDEKYYIFSVHGPRRFLSYGDYARSRELMKGCYVVGFLLILMLMPIGRHFGYIWTGLGFAIAFAWFFTFGNTMLTANSVPADVADTWRDRQGRSAVAMGKPMLWIGLLISLGFVVGGAAIFALDTDSRLIAVGAIVFFSFCAIIWMFLLIRSYKLDRAANEANLAAPDDTASSLILPAVQQDLESASGDAATIDTSTPSYPESSDGIRSNGSGRRSWPMIAGVAIIAALFGGGLVLLFMPSGPFATPITETDAMEIAATGSAAEPDSNAAHGANAEFTPEESMLIKQAAGAWWEYRDAVPGAYERHSALLDQLLAKGICWGHGDQPQREYAYHRCDDGSIQMQSLTDALDEPATPESGLGTPGRCLLRIEEATYISGECLNQVDPDGSFQISAMDGGYVATVLLDGSSGQGYWNGTPEAAHADVSLGTMVRDGACWQNESARICAWK